MTTEKIDQLGLKYEAWLRRRSAWRFDDDGVMIHHPTLNVMQLVIQNVTMQTENERGFVQFVEQRYYTNIGIMVLLMWIMDIQTNGVELSMYLDQMCNEHAEPEDNQIDRFLSYFIDPTGKGTLFDQLTLHRRMELFPWRGLGVDTLASCAEMVINAIESVDFIVVTGPLEPQ